MKRHFLLWPLAQLFPAGWANHQSSQYNAYGLSALITVLPLLAEGEGGIPFPKHRVILYNICTDHWMTFFNKNFAVKNFNFFCFPE
jgi:hypothetical protein